MLWFEPHPAEEVRVGNVVVCFQYDDRGRPKLGIHAPGDIVILREPAERIARKPCKTARGKRRMRR